MKFFNYVTDENGDLVISRKETYVGLLCPHYAKWQLAMNGYVVTANKSLSMAKTILLLVYILHKIEEAVK